MGTAGQDRVGVLWAGTKLHATPALPHRSPTFPWSWGWSSYFRSWPER